MRKVREKNNKQHDHVVLIHTVKLIRQKNEKFQKSRQEQRSYHVTRSTCVGQDYCVTYELSLQQIIYFLMKFYLRQEFHRGKFQSIRCPYFILILN